MTTALVLALGLVLGVDWRVMLGAGLAVWAPVPAAILTAGATLGWRRPDAPADVDVRFAETVVGELRSGASLRRALRAACGTLPETEAILRRLDVGAPLAEALRGLSPRLPTLGDLVEAAVATGAAGGRMLPVFEELLVQATAELAAAAELRAALAPVRASLAILVGGPVAYLAWRGADGSLGRLLASPAGAALALGGGALFVTGIAVMGVMIRSGR